jgi:hypothetical protein
MFGFITYIVLVQYVNSGLIIITHGRIGNRHMKFLADICSPDPLCCSECKRLIYWASHIDVATDLYFIEL